MASDKKGRGSSDQQPFFHINKKKSAGRGGSRDPSPAIDLDHFKKRLKILYSHWNERKSDLWQSSHVISMAYPPESAEHPKSAALSLWLLGHEFKDTIMVFMETVMHVLCSTESATILEALQGPAREAIGADCLLHVKGSRADQEAVLRLMDGLLEDISKRTGFSILTVGHVAREASRGWLARAWTGKLRSLNFSLRDVVAGFSDLFSVKDRREIMNVRKAAYLTDNVMRNYMKPLIEDAVDEEGSEAHSRLTEKVKGAVSKVALRANERLQMDLGGVGICFGPIIQSGGGFDIRPHHAASSSGLLQYDTAGVAIIGLGCSYKGYCSVIARMMLFDPSTWQEKAYNVLVTAEKAVVSSLRPGVKLSAVYQAAVSVVEREFPELVPHLTETAGSSMGLEFLEIGWAIEARNEKFVRQNMVFNVYLGLQDLLKDPKKPNGCTFSMVLADTVIVEGEETKVVTRRCSKLPEDVSYSFTEEDDEEEKEKMPQAFDGKEAKRIAVTGEGTHKMISGELMLEQLLDMQPNVPKGPRSARRRRLG
ncbi:hypothetical protein SAY87_003509 [Trapa incisa]|uniref:FACT complex subunit n=1 Tax=Trapa incisa TaxID=236973 RepID=A0AAN7KPD7_9MYRT|nr:hypothetical protein SAY87_003509 [Trapa incisa]